MKKLKFIIPLYTIVCFLPSTQLVTSCSKNNYTEKGLLFSVVNGGAYVKIDPNYTNIPNVINIKPTYYDKATNKTYDVVGFDVKYNSEKKQYIGGFANNSNLKSITIPSTIKAIEAGTFSNCHNLETIILPLDSESKLSYIGKESFQNCTALKNIILPSSLNRIDHKAFIGANPALFSKQDAGTKGEKLVYLKKDQKHSNDYFVALGIEQYTPRYGYDIVFNSSTRIIADWFIKSLGTIKDRDYPIIQSITFNEGLKTIGESSFEVIDNIHNRAEIIDIPGSVNEIGTSAFADQLNFSSSIKTLTLHEGTKIISAGAFACATKLSKIVIPSTVEYIGSNMEPLKKEDGTWVPGAFEECGNDTDGLDVTFAKNSNLRALGANCFVMCRKMSKSFQLPSKLEKIGSQALFFKEPSQPDFYNITLPKTLNEMHCPFGVCSPNNSRTYIIVGNETLTFEDTISAWKWSANNIEIKPLENGKLSEQDFLNFSSRTIDPLQESCWIKLKNIS